MKYTTIIAVFAGTVGFADALKVERHHRVYNVENVQQQSTIRPNPLLQPWAVKLKPSELPPVTKITDAYSVLDKQSAFYERVVPEQFSKGSDDRLMWSLCE